MAQGTEFWIAPPLNSSLYVPGRLSMPRKINSNQRERSFFDFPNEYSLNGSSLPFQGVGEAIATYPVEIGFNQIDHLHLYFPKIEG